MHLRDRPEVGLHAPGPLDLQRYGLRPAAVVDPACRASVWCVLAHDLGPVRARLVQRGLVAESLVDEAIAEYRRYLVLARLREPLGLGDALGMYSPEVDEVWHAHLVHTRDYAALCERAFGAFLHHEPLSGPASVDEILAGRGTFARAYGRVFEGPISGLWRLDSTPQSVEALAAALAGDPEALAAFEAALPRLAAALLAP